MQTNEKNWRNIASQIIKYELKKHSIKYGELKKRLEEIGIKETENSLSLKISRGSFSAVFFLQVLYAIDTDKLQLALVKSLLAQAEDKE